jgi:molybdopterin synthase sulfur carrier subunit
MTATVRIPTPLRGVTNGLDRANVNEGSMKDVVQELEEQFPGIKARLCDDEGNLRSFVNVYVNGEDIRFMDNMDSAIKSGDEISVVPAVAGGF